MISRTLLVFVMVYFLSDFSRGQSDVKFFRNDYTYIEAVEGFYKYHSETRGWAAAKGVCSLEGGTLWHPDDEAERDAVIAFWNKTNSYSSLVYVGLSSLVIPDMLETVDGKSVSEVYNNWDSNQPDEDSPSKCVVLNKEGYLDDTVCYKSFAFICKKSLQTLEWNYSCNMSNLDYIYNEGLGKCYKLYTTPLSWESAYVVCRAEQSYLAVIDTPMESEYFVNLTESVVNLQETYQRGIYHLGFHNKYEDGWWTVTGKRLSADAWLGNYLPSEGDAKKCGSMFYTGRLNNIDCDTKSFFICEHDVSSSHLNQEENKGQLQEER